MSLHVVKSDGSFHERFKVPNITNYNQWCDKFKKDDLEKVRQYIKSRVNCYPRFSIATLFPKTEWENTPLMLITGITNDNEVDAALLLGRITCEVLMEEEESWLCTQTNFSNRDFETNFYWKGKVKESKDLADLVSVFNSRSRI